MYHTMAKPHPAAHGHAARHRHPVLPLAMASEGEPVTVDLLRFGDDHHQRQLEEMGFVPGTHLTVVSRSSMGLIVQVKGARLALDRHMAMHIMVYPREHGC